MDFITFYRINFNMIHHHKWDGEYIEGLYPFERDIYVELLMAEIEKQQGQNQDGVRFDDPKSVP